MPVGPFEDEARAWLPVLSATLDARRQNVDLCTQYFNGDHRLRLATQKFREAFGEAFRTSSNWCPLIVEASVERLAVTGFRFGTDAGADQDAWAIWQANNLDAESLMLHSEAVKCGSAFLLVSPADMPGEQPLVTVELPEQCVVAYDPGHRRRRLAALKRWSDGTRTLSTVYLPDGAYRFQRDQQTTAEGLSLGSYVGAQQWMLREETDPYVPHDAGAVQMVELANNPTMARGGRSDIAPVIPLVDLANKLLCDLAVASEFYAYPQRVLTNLEVPTDADGTPLNIDLRAALTRVLTFSDDVGVHSFQPGDLNNYIQAVEKIERTIAAQTRIPAHYLLTGNSVAPSGESIKSVEAGLVKRVRRKMLDFSDPWEEAMRLAFRMKGDERRGTASDAETIWADPETRTEAEHVDATLKLRGLLSDETLMERLGMTPTEIERELKRKREQVTSDPSLVVGAVREPDSQLFTGQLAASVPQQPGSPAAPTLA